MKRSIKDNNKLLRVLYIPPKMDDKLHALAKAKRKSFSWIVEHCVKLGMKVKNKNEARI